MKKTKDEAAITRQTLLDAAKQVFSSKGFNQTSLEAVAMEAGVTRGAIYWHFGNKIEMFRAVLEQCYQNAEIKVDKILESKQPPVEKIRLLLRELFLILANETDFRIMEEIRMFQYYKNKKLQEIYQFHQDNVFEIKGLMTTLIEEGIRSGELEQNLDPGIVVLALISYLAGIRSSWLSGVFEIPIATNAAQLADIFITGIAKRS